MKNLIKKLVVEEEGQGMTEYALVLGVIAIGAIVLITAFRGQVTALWNKITGEMETTVGGITASPTP